MSRLLLSLPLSLSGCAVVPGTLDLSDRPIDEAIGLSLDHLEAAYSFTEHKRLDWDAARAQLQPLADAAAGEAQLDDVVRRLVPLLPDAHVQLFHDDPERDLCPEARHGFGVALAQLDDGRVIVAHVDGARGADLRAGDELIRWGGVPVEEARGAVAFQCFPLGAATHERIRQVQLRLLARGPVGAVVDVQLRRDGALHTTQLVAGPDTTDVREALGIELPTTLVAHRVLPSGVGYVSIGWEETYLAEVRVQRALSELRDAPGLVVDLRDNDGGMEQPAAKIAGLFSTGTSFYETVTFLNNHTLEQEVISELWVTPGELYWGRPTAVLIDGETVSSGEGLAMLLSRMPQVEIFGLEGTAASFGSTGSAIALPGGWRLAFPGGRSLDRDGEIQLDSDHTLQGGVHPTRRVPWTEHTLVRHHAGEDVVLEAAVAWIQEVTR